MAGMRRATRLVSRIVALEGTKAAAAAAPASAASQVLNRIIPLHTTSANKCIMKVPPFLRAEQGRLAPAVKLFHARSIMGIYTRFVSGGLSSVPALSDPQAKEALNMLLATNWSAIGKDVSEAVETAIAKGVQEGKILSTVWSSAQACEKFADTLIALRMDLDQLSGDSGEYVGRLPDEYSRALESAYKKYTEYLESFGEGEDFIKKKVENDLGGILVQIKQRCNGLDPKWGKISLLGTSGLSGSYIELRHTA